MAVAHLTPSSLGLNRRAALSAAATLAAAASCAAWAVKRRSIASAPTATCSARTYICARHAGTPSTDAFNYLLTTKRRLRGVRLAHLRASDAPWAVPRAPRPVAVRNGQRRALHDRVSAPCGTSAPRVYAVGVVPIVSSAAELMEVV